MSQPVWVAGVIGWHLVREYEKDIIKNMKKKRTDEKREAYESPHQNDEESQSNTRRTTNQKSDSSP